MALVSWGLADEAPDSLPSALSGLLTQCSQSQAPPRHCYSLSKLTFVDLNRASATQEDWMLGPISQVTSCLQCAKWYPKLLLCSGPWQEFLYINSWDRGWATLWICMQHGEASQPWELVLQLSFMLNQPATSGPCGSQVTYLRPTA